MIFIVGMCVYVCVWGGGDKVKKKVLMLFFFKNGFVFFIPHFKK